MFFQFLKVQLVVVKLDEVSLIGALYVSADEPESTIALYVVAS